MKFCTECGRVDDGGRFCPNCGTAHKPKQVTESIREDFITEMPQSMTAVKSKLSKKRITLIIGLCIAFIGIVVIIIATYVAEKQRQEFAEHNTRMFHQRNPGDAERNLGDEAFQRENYSQAITHYRKAIELQPTSSAYLGLANSYVALGTQNSNIHHYDEAIKILKEGIETFPNNSTLQTRLEEVETIKALAGALTR
jgi:tetratricopeptide (TPR) repeat protein